MQDKTRVFLENESNLSSVRRPAFCCISLSAMCTLRCKMCFTWKNKYVKTPQEPTLEEWSYFIKALGDLSDNSIEISFAGGEPLLDDRNLALVGFSSRMGLSTSMPTSGFLINEEAARKIAQSGLNAIGISLDGIKKDTHDFLRGTEGCYEKAMQAIGLLDKYKKSQDLQISILTLISEKNLNEIIGLTRSINEDKRVEVIAFQAITQPFYTPLDSQWYLKDEYRFLWPKDIDKVNSVMDELISLKYRGYKIVNPVAQLETFKKYFKTPQEFIKKKECNVDYYMHIDQLGEVYMCTCKEPIGNIKKDNPRDIWYSQKADQVRAEIKECRKNCHHLLNCYYEKE